MVGISIYEKDPYDKSHYNTNHFISEDIWKPFFDIHAKISTKYILMDDGVQLLLIKSTPVENGGKPILLIPGWFSVITAWYHTLKEISKRNVVYYLETREKTSSIHPGKKVKYGVDRLAKDFDIVIPKLEHKLDEILLVGSSIGGTMLFHYLANYNFKPYLTVLIGPNPYIELFPFAFLGYNMPVFLFSLTIRYAYWHLKKFRMSKEEESHQMIKLRQTLRLAIPRRLKYSVKNLKQYNAWNEDIEVILDKIVLVGAVTDKLHSIEKTRKLRDALQNSGYLEYESNYGTHSTDFAKDLVRISLGDTKFINWT